MSINTLFSPYMLSGNPLKNRFLMAPMTRSRATEPGDVPNALMAEYYEQRASAGIIITEATQISMQGMGYAKTPGIYSKAQMKVGNSQLTLYTKLEVRFSCNFGMLVE
jgi:N-ethylmaleimide reductase